METKFYETNAKAIRRKIIELTNRANMSHIGGALSIVDIVNALYFKIMNINPSNPEKNDRDKFILSKGHCGLALYSTLARRGYFSEEDLQSYCQDKSKFKGHVDIFTAPGIEATTGSLGHGLSMGAGMALANKINKNPGRVYVLLGDGECQEGSVWEAAITASRLGLDNLIAIIDANGLQGFNKCEDILPKNRLKDMWKSAGWSLKEINAHDYTEIMPCFESIPFRKSKPNLVFANSIKGKGVSFMENKLEWHYKSPNLAQLKEALEELK